MSVPVGALKILQDFVNPAPHSIVVSFPFPTEPFCKMVMLLIFPKVPGSLACQKAFVEHVELA